MIFLIYIKLIEKKEMIDTRNDFLKFIEKMRDKFIKLKEEKIDNKTLIVIKKSPSLIGGFFYSRINLLATAKP